MDLRFVQRTSTLWDVLDDHGVLVGTIAVDVSELSLGIGYCVETYGHQRPPWRSYGHRTVAAALGALRDHLELAGGGQPGG